MNFRQFGIFITCIFAVILSLMFITACTSSNAPPENDNTFLCDGDFAELKKFHADGYTLRFFEIHYKGHDYFYLPNSHNFYHAPHCECRNVDLNSSMIVPSASTLNFNW